MKKSLYMTVMGGEGNNTAGADLTGRVSLWHNVFITVNYSSKQIIRVHILARSITQVIVYSSDNKDVVNFIVIHVGGHISIVQQSLGPMAMSDNIYQQREVYDVTKGTYRHVHVLPTFLKPLHIGLYRVVVGICYAIIKSFSSKPFKFQFSTISSNTGTYNIH